MSICVSRAFCSTDYKKKERLLIVQITVQCMPDPDLEIRGRGWGAVIQTLRKGGGLQKIFSALGASVLSKNKGGGLGPAGPLVPPLH